jgi:chemotaxis protein MotB
MAHQPERPIVMIKRVKKVAAGHHGGAWKVAYADFVTAMMAFFLVMWLVATVSPEQRAAMFDYFKNPSMEPGKSVRPSPGMQGPGGASTSPINLRGGLDAPRVLQSVKPGIGAPVTPSSKVNSKGGAQSDDVDDSIKEKKRLELLLQSLKEAIDKSAALEPFKKQLLLDITSEGLRIQIVDAQNRPMFDRGSSSLKAYTNSILHELTPYLNSVPNHISLTGHTDVTPYLGTSGLSNWDLSSERANAARRALEASGLSSEKVTRVVGLSSSVLFDKKNPTSPINRRISLIQKVEGPVSLGTGGNKPANAAKAPPLADSATLPPIAPALAAVAASNPAPLATPKRTLPERSH